MDTNFEVQINEKTEYTTQNMPAKKPVKDKGLRRSLIGSIVFLVAIVSIFTAQTFAYFTDSSSAEANKIITGSIDVSIIEVNGDGNFDLTAEPIKIMPASVVPYGDVGAKNAGTVPIYIRIKVEKTIIQSEHEISPGWKDLIACNFMTGDEDLWVYHEGYYYYKYALSPGEQTTALFNKVIFDPSMNNEFKNSSIQFRLICQSVQSGGNSSDPTTAWGWPEEQSISE